MSNEQMFRIADTKLPVIPIGTLYKLTYDKYFTETAVSRDNLISYGYFKIDEEVYIQCDYPNFIGTNFFLIKESTIIKLAKEQGMLEQEFVLPEKWCVKADGEGGLTSKYFNSQSNSVCYESYSIGYLHRFNLSNEDIITKGNLHSTFHSYEIRKYYTEITFEQFKKYVLKIDDMKDSRFPFNLDFEQAKKILKIACAFWKEKLKNLWFDGLVSDGYVIISEEEYKEMRKACTDEQHKLFDEIFGKDEIKSPYKDGEACVVKNFITHSWTIKYATGRCNDEGKPTFYICETSGSAGTYIFHNTLKKEFGDILNLK
jgi:hypothetical protein